MFPKGANAAAEIDAIPDPATTLEQFKIKVNSEIENKILGFVDRLLEQIKVNKNIKLKIKQKVIQLVKENIIDEVTAFLNKLDAGSFNLERAKEEIEANKLRSDAKILEEAGCFGLVLEKIPALLAKEVSESLHIPTIGIGAGMHCDGQVLVMHDMLGINTTFKPRFLRTYLNMAEQVTSAVQQYIADVKSKSFPNESEQY